MMYMKKVFFTILVLLLLWIWYVYFVDQKNDQKHESDTLEQFDKNTPSDIWFDYLFSVSITDSSSANNRKNLTIKSQEPVLTKDTLFEESKVILTYPDKSKNIFTPVSRSENFASFLIRKLDLSGSYTAELVVKESSWKQYTKIIDFSIK